jgi:hypothetical protein
MITKPHYRIALVIWAGILMSPVSLASDTPGVTQADARSGVEESVFVPPDDGYDWLQLTSGEWLKGKLTGLFDDKVEFDSEILDDLVIDIEDVRGFYSSREFGVSLRGKEMISGKIRVEEQQVFLITEKEELIVSGGELIAITESVQRERDRWSGNLILGINLRQGNTELTEYNMTAGVERRTPQSRAFIDYLGNFNETEDERIANNHRVNLVFDRFSGSRLFWRPVIGQYLKDPFQNIKHQVTLETGIGYELVNTRKTDWGIYSGAGGNHVRRVSVEPEQEKNSTSPAWTIGTHFDTELTSWVDYLFTFHATFLDDESGEYQHHLVSTLSTDLVGDIDFDISFIWDRTQNPPPRADGTPVEKDDFRLMTGIGFDF